MEIKFLVAQLESSVGNIEQNYQKIKKVFLEAEKKNFDFLISTELALSGYPPKDLLLRKDFINSTKIYLNKLKDLTNKKQCILCLGSPYLKNKELYNSLLICNGGKIKQIINKTILPNYGVFDEKRYFNPGEIGSNIFHYKNKRICFLICEDFWNIKFVKHQLIHKPDIIIVINASPFEKKKYQERINTAKEIVKKSGCTIIYSNLTNAQDDLVFDGGSFCMSKNQTVIYQAPFFEENNLEVTFPLKKNKLSKAYDVKEYMVTYKALVYSLRKYLDKSGFKKVLIGISGGIDSALCATIACDAIGSSNVSGYLLPSKYTSKESIRDAQKLSKNLNINLKNIDIEKILDSYNKQLRPYFRGFSKDITEENLQSRIRGSLLMSLSNKFKHLLITTGNKSELAVGYSTLYGDMCGGFSILKDVYKTEVFELAKWRNQSTNKYFLLKKKKLIPNNIILKEPTAELKENQKDSDSLPPYDILDKILYFLIDEGVSKDVIIKKGFEERLVNEIWNMLKNSEFKRYQSAIGPKVSRMNFDNDRRFPIINDYKI